MRKFYSLIYIIAFIGFSMLSISCEALGFGNDDEIIPFEIGDSIHFYLQDLNINSATYGDKIGPQSFTGKVVLIYFTSNETWDICIDRFDQLYQIFQDNINEDTDFQQVMLIGLGKHNSTSINEILADNKITPWVKDESNNDTWAKFDAINRDLFFVNKNGIFDSKVNLSSFFDEYLIQGTIYQLLNE